MCNQGQGLPSHFIQDLFVVFAYTRPRYQVSVYRTIGPLVYKVGTYRNRLCTLIFCYEHLKIVKNSNEWI